MLFKNSFLLASALTASTAVARLHGHERRHAHPKAEIEEPQLPTVTDAPTLEDRAVGDVVVATINGVLESWINEWSGEAASESSSSSSTTFVVVPTTTAAAVPEFTASPSQVESTVTPVPTSSPSGGNWYETPSSGSYSSAGFGGQTEGKYVGPLDWDYVGNVGIPWGSNIIQVDEANANQYKHVMRFEGSETEPWTVVFWNTWGPDGKMDGFWKPNAALKFTLEKGEVKYVAVDDNSQGGWAAAPGEDIPTTTFGQYAATWGEFDMSSARNKYFSGWDVSCIIAELNGLEIQGMKICNHLGESCSYIGKGLAGLLSAYTSADQGNPALAVSQSEGPVRLVVTLDYVE
ncbi:Allergen [Penicillium sp. IBT 18751x]|nr:Allergen [Penicillium sp. IBT 18751x]